MFATKGRRLLLIGGIAVVALAGVLIFTMSRSSGPETVASTRMPSAKARSTATTGSDALGGAAPAAKPAGDAMAGAEAADAKSTDAKSTDEMTAGADVSDEVTAAEPAPTATAAMPATTAPQVPTEVAEADDVADANPSKKPDPDSVFERASYTYRSLGRVDPFRSLIIKKDGAQRAFAEKLDPEMLTLVGVLTNGGERRALVEDVHGFGYVLKEGDRVLRGRVVSIGEESMKIRHTMYGVTETTTLSLVQKSQGRGLPNDRLR